jgi:hypothetical protein
MKNLIVLLVVAAIAASTLAGCNSQPVDLELTHICYWGQNSPIKVCLKNNGPNALQNYPVGVRCDVSQPKGGTWVKVSGDWTGETISLNPGDTHCFKLSPKLSFAGIPTSGPSGVPPCLDAQCTILAFINGDTPSNNIGRAYLCDPGYFASSQVTGCLNQVGGTGSGDWQPSPPGQLPPAQQPQPKQAPTEQPPEQPPAGAPPAEPQITFTADRTDLKPGECAMLRWSVQGGKFFEVRLNNQVMEASGQKQVCPTETMLYALGVDLGTKMERREITIAVAGPGPTLTRPPEPTPPPPPTQPPEPTPPPLPPHPPEPTPPPPPTQPPEPTPPPPPTQPLEPTPPPPGCAGPPVIPYFTADPSVITAGQKSTLSWGNVTNGTTGPLVRSVVIEPGLGEVGSGASSRQVSPTSTTTYTMTATGCGGTTTQEVTVIVRPAPAPSEPTPTPYR